MACAAARPAAQSSVQHRQPHSNMHHTPVARSAASVSCSWQASTSCTASSGQLRCRSHAAPPRPRHTAGTPASCTWRRFPALPSQAARLAPVRAGMADGGMPEWTLDQIAGLAFSGVLVAAMLSADRVDKYVARQQRKELGLCVECGGLYEPGTCAQEGCPMRQVGGGSDAAPGASSGAAASSSSSASSSSANSSAGGG